MLANIQHKDIAGSMDMPDTEIHKTGLTKEQVVKVRVNQSFFRSTVLASYNNTCCITDIQQPELLIASHIRPWSIDEKNRLNPTNGIAINALHDKAFEAGLLTITPKYQIRISSRLYKARTAPNIEDFFLRFDGKDIILPSRFLPNPAFLEYHNSERFME
jgi:putative restriction endonuclease